MIPFLCLYLVLSNSVQAFLPASRGVWMMSQRSFSLSSSKVQFCKVKEGRHILYYDQKAASFIFHYLQSAQQMKEIRFTAPTPHLHDLDFIPSLQSTSQQEYLGLRIAIIYYDQQSHAYVVSIANTSTLLSWEKVPEHCTMTFQPIYESTSTPRRLFLQDKGDFVFLVQCDGRCISICTKTGRHTELWHLSHTYGLVHTAYLQDKLWFMDMDRKIYMVCPLTGHCEMFFDLNQFTPGIRFPTCWHPSLNPYHHSIQIVIGYENGTLSRSMYDLSKQQHVQTSLVHTPFGVIKRIYADDQRYIIVNARGQVYTASMTNETFWHRLPIRLDMNYFHRFYANKKYLLTDGHPHGAVIYDISQVKEENKVERAIMGNVVSSKSQDFQPTMMSYLDFLRQTPVIRSNPTMIGTNPWIDLPSDVNPTE